MIPSFPTYIFINDQTLVRKSMPNVLRSEMETGPQKTRPIQSTPMFQVSCEISICDDKFNDFRAWYKNDVAWGAYWFLMFDPFDGTKRRFRFAEYDGDWAKTGNLMRTSVVLEAYDEL